MTTRRGRLARLARLEARLGARAAAAERLAEIKALLASPEADRLSLEQLTDLCFEILRLSRPRQPDGDDDGLGEWL